MGSGIFFPICALPIIIIIILTFNLKKHIKSDETKLYNILCFANLIGLILEIECSFACNNYDSNMLLSSIILKSYQIYLLIWTSIFTTYIYRISTTNRSRLLHYISIIFLFIASVIIFILPIEVNLVKDLHVHYTTGTSVNFTFLISFIYVLFILILLVKNIKNIKSRKYLPVFLFFVLGIISILVQRFYPQFLLLTYAETLICLCMYFTIENPDIKMIKQLQMAKDEADRANRAKSDFLSSMSHEIRTPLNVIVGLSEDNINYKDEIPHDVLENSYDIINASQTLLEIVGNILDINKIEANKMELVENKYNLKKEVEKLCKITETRIGEKNIKFSLLFAHDIPYELIGDKGKIKEVINNLLTNAIKYTSDGNIDLSIKCINNLKDERSNIIITCKDTGCGIKKDHIKKLFEKFERLDIEKNSTTEGTGLGLAITKALIDMMGGTINVQSIIGQGSIFVVTIPQKISKLSKGRDDEYEDTLYNIDSNIINKVNTSNYSNKKILIVDDNKLNIKVCKKAIEGMNFIIDECYDGKECVDKIIQGNEYDLILMDIMMPNMSGKSALLKLKENKNFNIPTIALTADALGGAKDKYLNDGFVDYISKPFNKSEIIDKINKIFKDDMNII